MNEPHAPQFGPAQPGWPPSEPRGDQSGASPPKSKSRKVNAYVKLVLKYRDAIRKADRMLPEIRLRRAALSGGQLAEANRLLQPSAASALPAPDSRAPPAAGRSRRPSGLRSED
jgi:hypothetical protein